MRDATTDFYFAYNMPVQATPINEKEDDEKSPVVDYVLLNYMPRKEMFSKIKMSDIFECEEDFLKHKENFFNCAADHFLNLARQFRALAKGEQEGVYYHDAGM